MPVRNSIHLLSKEITNYRRLMHENPQTAFEEEFISNLVTEKLTDWGISFEKGIAKTGVVATIHGKKNDSGSRYGLRADIDALDIQEENNKPWVSKTSGKMHACGHDGHTAMLLGAAKYLNETRNFNGTAHLIFQPAEEGQKGANKMIEEGLFQSFPCDKIFGMHNWPQFPAGEIGMRAGPMMASGDMFTIVIHGKGGHAAMPHETIDPIVIGSQIISALQTLISRTSNPTEAVVLSITNFNAGTGAYNIIPDTAVLKGTFRTFNQDIRISLKEKIGIISTQIAQSLGASIEYTYEFVFEPTINDLAATEFCTKIAKRVVGPGNVNNNITPIMVSEDFGAMLAECSGCYILLGQGDPQHPESNFNQGLHTPKYDFNDGVIPIGIEYFVNIIEEGMPLVND